MQRLPFSLPDFCRVSWSNEAAREHWQPLVDQGSRFWHRLELETVLQGQREAGIVAVEGANMSAVLCQCAKYRMELRPLFSLAPGTRYISNLTSQHNGSGIQMCAVGRPSAVAKVEAAFVGKQSATLGRMLGYPGCCIAFFEEVWDRQRYIDTTWKMAEETVGQLGSSQGHDRTIVTTAPAELNVLVRWLGIRPSFHLPCSFACSESVGIAREIASVAAKIGCSESISSIYRILRWPIQWSALHGIAEIETPVLRISTRSDATALKYTVRIQCGDEPVAHEARGNRFPFAKPRSRSKSRTVRVVPDQRTETEAEQWVYVRNGYRSRADMERAFAVIASSLFARQPRSIAHLYCRNGALLRFAADRSPGLVVSGLDPSVDGIAQAKVLLPNHAERLKIGDPHDASIVDGLWHADAYLVMAGRLTEMPREQAQAIVSAMRGKSKGILLYAFDDWLKRESLDQMATKLGAALSSGGVTTEYASARWLA